MKKKFGLALGGGGSRGVAHIGVIKALEEEGLKPDFVSGCSMGSVVGACYAMGMSCEEMMEKVSKLKTIKLVDLSAAPITRLALLRGNKMQKLISGELGDITFDQLKIPFSCVASDLYSGRLVHIKEGSVATAVCASSSIPIIFPPVKLEDKLLVDGGVLCRVPTEQVKELGATKVIAVDVLVNTGESVKKVKNIVAMVTRVFDMMDYNGSEMKKQILKSENELWLQPEMKGMSQYVVKDLVRAYREGYETAKAKMPDIIEFLK